MYWGTPYLLFGCTQLVEQTDIYMYTRTYVWDGMTNWILGVYTSAPLAHPLQLRCNCLLGEVSAIQPLSRAENTSPRRKGWQLDVCPEPAFLFVSAVFALFFFVFALLFCFSSEQRSVVRNSNYLPYHILCPFRPEDHFDFLQWQSLSPVNHQSSIFNPELVEALNSEN